MKRGKAIWALPAVLLLPALAIGGLVLRRVMALARVGLADPAGGGTPGRGEVKTLQDAFPALCFAYRFELLGQTVSTKDERIKHVPAPIGNEGVDELRRALPLLKGCRYFLLDNCRIDNGVLARLGTNSRRQRSSGGFISNT